MDAILETVEGMRFQRVGHDHFLCYSQNQTNTAYTVSLLDYDGLGSCSCLDFTTRRFPRWRLTHKLHQVFRCKHIRNVRNFVMDLKVQESIKALKEKHIHQSE